MQQSTDRRYWLMSDNTPTGPYTVLQIHAKLAEGEITWQTPACEIGGSPWRPLIETPHLGPGTAPQQEAVRKGYDEPWQANEPAPASSEVRTLQALPRLFRTLVAVEIVLMLLSAGLSILDSALRNDPQGDGAFSPSEGLACMVFVVLLPASIAAWIGMIQLRNWGRWLYLGTTGFVHVSSLGMSLVSFSAEWHFPHAIDSLGSTVGGVLIGIAFFSTLSREFRKNS